VKREEKLARAGDTAFNTNPPACLRENKLDERREAVRARSEAIKELRYVKEGLGGTGCKIGHTGQSTRLRF
jgi:hypothetical protein